VTNAQLEQVVMAQARVLDEQRREIRRLRLEVAKRVEPEDLRDSRVYRMGYSAGNAAKRRAVAA